MKDDVNDEMPNGTPKTLILSNGVVNWDGVLKLGDRPKCCNPNLGLPIKAKVCKNAGQGRSSRIPSHAPRSVGKCEGMNLHSPKGVSILGVGAPMDS